jgi:RHS repeat-associated protein
LTKDTTNTSDYAYDPDGSLISDGNKGIKRIHYNFLNLPDTISMVKPDSSSKGNIVYKYDAMGTKWAKIVTDSTVTPVRKTTTLYIQGVQYVNDTIQFISHEEGRTRYFFQHYMAGDSSFQRRFDYFVKDHLGNTRMVLTEQRDTGVYMATMEAAYRTKEKALFYNIDSCSYAVSAVPGGYPTDGTTNPNDSLARVNGSIHPMGPALLLKVMSGDSLTILSKAFFRSGGSTSQTQSAVPNILASLAGGLAGMTGASHGTASQLNVGSSPVGLSLDRFVNNYDGTPATTPKAYLNWMVLDNQFQYDSASSGALPVTTPDQPLSLVKQIKLKNSGYMYIWVSNETKGWDVFFDNIKVTHYVGPMVEENHYYPFGLVMAGISDKALKGGYAENKYRYNKGSELQNKEFADGSGLEMYETHLRELDPQLGRWWQIDPVFTNGIDGDDETNGVIIGGLKSQSPYASMDNNPISLDDPNGDCPECLVQMAEAWEAAAGSGAWGAAATTESGSSGSTMGPGEAIVAALNPVGAWHGMQKAWNSLTESSTSETIPELGASSHGEITFNGVGYPTMPLQPAGTITLSSSDQAALNKLNESLGILPPQGAIPKAPLAANPPATQQQAFGNLPKAGKGKGTVPPSQRDPKRVWTKKERVEQLKKQEGKCANCGQPKTVDETQGHHEKRHADGGKTVPENHKEVCKECHTDLHS